MAPYLCYNSMVEVCTQFYVLHQCNHKVDSEFELCDKHLAKDKNGSVRCSKDIIPYVQRSKSTHKCRKCGTSDPKTRTSTT